MSHQTALPKIARQQRDKIDQTVTLNKKETVLFNLQEDSDEDKSYVNLRYYRREFQCLSAWTEDELRAFSAFCSKLTRTKWAEIYRTGGTIGDKQGFGFTVHKDRQHLPRNPELEAINLDMRWFELRVSGKARVHGFRSKSAFFLVFLDRAHEIYPGK